MIQGRKIIGLVACDPNGVIGKNGALPWSYPEELDHFRQTTYQQIMVMGRKTYESIPLTSLKDRFSIVFSRSPAPPHISSDRVLFVSSLDAFLNLPPLPSPKEIFMIGGGELANLFFTANLMEEFILTKIHKTYEGDAFFPLHFLANWSSLLIRKEKDFSIYRYIK